MVENQISDKNSRLYVYSKEVNPRILTYQNAVELMKELNPTVMFPVNPRDIILELYGIKPLKAKNRLNSELIDSAFNTKVVISKPYQINDEWFFDISYELDEQYLDDAWQEFRSKRNNILASLDWVESSDTVTPKTKSRIKAYKQVLRDITKVTSNPLSLELPSIPLIEYKKKSKDFDRELTIEEIEKIKCFIPKDKDKEGWNHFLKEWQLLSQKSHHLIFVSSSNIVSNLINSYTDLNLDEII